MGPAWRAALLTCDAQLHPANLLPALQSCPHTSSPSPPHQGHAYVLALQCAGPFAGKALSEARSEAVQLSPQRLWHQRLHALFPEHWSKTLHVSRHLSVSGARLPWGLLHTRHITERRNPWSGNPVSSDFSWGTSDLHLKVLSGCIPSLEAAIWYQNLNSKNSTKPSGIWHPDLGDLPSFHGSHEMPLCRDPLAR